MTRTLAYLDPGTGTLILQMIGGGVAALAVTMKLYGRRILRFLRLRKADPQPERPSRRDAH